MKPTFCTKPQAIDAYLNGGFYIFVEVTNYSKFAFLKISTANYGYPNLKLMFPNDDWQEIFDNNDAIEFGLLKRGDT